MFSTAKDKEEIANLKELLEGMLDEFDQSVATVKALINFTGDRSEDRYLMIVFGFADACGNIAKISEENTVAALQEFMSDPKAYRRMTSLLDDPSHIAWMKDAAQTIYDVFNNDGSVGPLLTLAEDYLSN